MRKYYMLGMIINRFFHYPAARYRVEGHDCWKLDLPEIISVLCSFLLRIFFLESIFKVGSVITNKIRIITCIGPTAKHSMINNNNN